MRSSAQSSRVARYSQGRFEGRKSSRGKVFRMEFVLWVSSGKARERENGTGGTRRSDFKYSYTNKTAFLYPAISRRSAPWERCLRWWEAVWWRSGNSVIGKKFSADVFHDFSEHWSSAKLPAYRSRELFITAKSSRSGGGITRASTTWRNWTRLGGDCDGKANKNETFWKFGCLI